jgi:hypothetical protein
MVSLSRRSRTLVAALALVALFGCSSSSERSSVHGAVRYDGEPVDDGGIAFLPEGGDGSAQIRATGEIRDGRYELDSTRGPTPGKYRVEIYWNKKTGRQLTSPSGLATKDETRQAIPAKYNERTELTVDVKPGRNTFDFDLKP